MHYLFATIRTTLYLKCVLLTVFYLSISLLNTIEGTCGKPFYAPILSATEEHGNRISNGIEARRHSHPWQALLSVWIRSSLLTCGGSLIDWRGGNASDLVLTAAHCVTDLEDNTEPSLWEEVTYFFNRLFKNGISGPTVNASDVRVFLGVHDLADLTPPTIHIGVSAIAIGEFNKFCHMDDFALLKLEREIVYNEFIQGICLPDESEDMPPPESPCLVTGWGLKANGKPAQTLQQMDAPIFYGYVDKSIFHKGRMICIYKKEKYAGTRRGDSGGPLACLKNDTFVIYGVLSFGIIENCNEGTKKTAFMKLPHYMKWIRTTIAQLGNN
uniref:Peptidase S1 domain-containing protein n=1 Tax=Trichuris muris TaxID=70415 RepID=A0A5S6QGB9_TRIMR